MPNHNDSVAADSKKNSNQSGQQQLSVDPQAAGRLQKEQESMAEEDKIMAEIHTTAEAYDRGKLEEVENLLTDEIKRVHPEPKLPPDVEDAGVYSPQVAADAVVSRGSTIELEASENVYKKGLHIKIAGHVVNKVVVGVSSLAALAILIGRLMKMAHKHAMKIVFRKGGEESV